MERLLVRTAPLLFLFAALGCQSTWHESPDGSIHSTVFPALQVPHSVERLAVLYPRSYQREFMNAYAQLAGAAFQLKESRPWLQIVERFDLPIIHGEHRYQSTGAVSDATAMHLGRGLGVDSILLFSIDGPTLRDRMLARMHGAYTPFTVVSKVIRVESAEVVFLNVVTIPVPHDGHDDLVRPVSLDALGKGITKTIRDLQHAFR
jgi:hypothetical protein